MHVETKKHNRKRRMADRVVTEVYFVKVYVHHLLLANMLE